MPATPHFHDPFGFRCVECDYWADWEVEGIAYCGNHVPVTIPEWERRFWASWTERAVQLRNAWDSRARERKRQRKRDVFDSI